MRNPFSPCLRIPRNVYTREVDTARLGIMLGALAYGVAVHLVVAYLVWRNR